MSGFIINPFAFAASGGGSGYTYHRLLITENNGGSVVGTRHLRLLTYEQEHIAVGGTASASSENAVGQAADAFDGSGDGWRNGGVLDLPEWLQYQTSEAEAIAAYGVGSHLDTDQTRAAKDWKLQGSNNGSDWTDLDTVTGETSWGANEVRFFELDHGITDAGYKYYRWDSSVNNGGSSWTAVAELGLRLEVGGASVAFHLLSGVATSPNGTSATFPAPNAFDGVESTHALMAKATASLMFEFPGPREIVQYAITSSTRAAADHAKEWTLKGSNDGVNWDLLDTVTDETAWGVNETRVFTL